MGSVYRVNIGIHLFFLSSPNPFPKGFPLLYFDLLLLIELSNAAILAVKVLYKFLYEVFASLTKSVEFFDLIFIIL